MQVGEELWSGLLALKARCDAEPGSVSMVNYDSTGLEVATTDEPVPNGKLAIIAKRRLSLPAAWAESVVVHDRLWLYTRPEIAAGVAETLRLYVPLCLASVISVIKPFVLVHMAQSLDGMVCTESGNSKWIGNDFNMTHAHRVRALVDGVMVGGNTAKKDLPSLSVRHVSGDHPVRILFSETFEEIDKLPTVDGGRTILLRSSKRAGLHSGPDTLYFDIEGGSANIRGLLDALRENGIRSIMIEGGPITFASFLGAGMVDWVQVHIAPLIFGSGKPLVSLPAIDEVEQAVALNSPFFTVLGDGVMVTGSL